MSICPNTNHACRCQPQEGVMCPHGPTPDDWRAAPVVQLDADLPPPKLPLPKPHMQLMEIEGSDDYPVFLTGQMHAFAQGYAREVALQYVERIRHLERELAGAQAELKAVETRMAASSDGGAQPAQSIEEDKKFQCLLYNYVAARMKLADGSGTKDEATDAFRALIAYIDGRTAGTASDAWISVKERLPQPGEQVLVTRYAGRVANKEHPGYPGKPWVEISSVWTTGAFFCDLCSTGNVTHWMRIAAAPSTQEGANEN